LLWIGLFHKFTRKNDVAVVQSDISWIFPSAEAENSADFSRVRVSELKNL
jgi:hypothetical protein